MRFQQRGGNADFAGVSLGLGGDHVRAAQTACPPATVANVEQVAGASLQAGHVLRCQHHAAVVLSLVLHRHHPQVNFLTFLLVDRAALEHLAGLAQGADHQPGHFGEGPRLRYQRDPHADDRGNQKPVERAHVGQPLHLGDAVADGFDQLRKADGEENQRDPSQKRPQRPRSRVAFPEGTQQDRDHQRRCDGSRKRSVRGVNRFEAVEHRHQAESEHCRYHRHHTGDDQVVAVAGALANVGAVNVVHTDHRRRVDQRVHRGHHGGNERGHDEAEHSRSAHHVGHDDENVAGGNVRIEHAQIDHGSTDPAHVGHRYGRQGHEQQNDKRGCLAALLHALGGEETQDHSLMHEVEGRCVGHAVLPEDADEAELRRLVEGRKSGFHLGRQVVQQHPKSTDGVQSEPEEHEARHQQQKSLE